MRGFRLLLMVGVVLGLGTACLERPNVGFDEDEDEDGYTSDVDCDDNNANVNPAADERCNGIDDDCDGSIPADEVDDDGDGYVECTLDGDWGGAGTGLGDDCDDGNAAYHPGALEEDCADPNDYNCDGSVGYEDADSDGWAACLECDDTEAAINPDADEICDGIDNNCDDLTDDSTAVDRSTWYIDYDQDGFGSSGVSRNDCDQPVGFVANNFDCDDLHADVYPDNPDTPEEDAAVEVCDGYDNDCDGTVDESDAVDATIWYADTDGDGFGNVLNNTVACDQPSGYVDDSSDCDDYNSWTNPGSYEICDAADNDCDGQIDEDAIDETVWYTDGDGDGYGTFENTVYACDQPSGYADNGNDCNDYDGGVYPGNGC